MTALHLSGCTYAWLYDSPLPHALRSLADHGFETLELTTAPPHLHPPELDREDRTRLSRLLGDLGLRVLSTNPTFCDVNLVSTNPEFRTLSEERMMADLELAADLEASFVVAVPGRLHSLAPAPLEISRPWLVEGLARLASRAESLGPALCLENNPYGFLGTSHELVEVVDEIDSTHLGIVYDVANALAIQDPAAGLREVAHRLMLSHISDTWRDRWAHTSPGRGEVDFAAFAAVLGEIGYRGPTVYELIDMEPPDPRLARDIEFLSEAGWSLTAPYRTATGP